MNIRRFNNNDAIEVSKIIEKCFRTQNLGNYTKESIENQINENSTEKLIKTSKQVRYFVSLDNDKIIGICGYDKNKVRTLFIDPEYQNKGIGSLLLKYVLAEAKNEGINELKCWSTKYAERFYNKNGFNKIRDLNIMLSNNSEIQFIEMRILL
jgi:N-acetylglutamate synthase-like GNAT family acetyltransferase